LRLGQEAPPHREVLGEVAGLQERRGLGHRTGTGTLSQQRAVWRGPSTVSGGLSSRQRSTAFGQRGWKAQPVGGAARSGGWPSMAVSRSRLSLIRGIESSSARV